MRYALVGYGRMGRAIEAAASARGHRNVLVVERGSKIPAGKWRGVDVAFEFTVGDGAAERVASLLARGISVVCGTTGWDAADPALRKAAKGSKAGAVIAPNFSIGMTLFASLVKDAAAAFRSAGGYDPYVVEWHHRGKRDAPSGTARRLAGLIDARGELPVASIRAGHEPGRHVVGFDGPDDVVTMTHEARGRAGFAAGAVVAGEWILGRRGIHGFDEVCRDLVREGRR